MNIAIIVAGGSGLRMKKSQRKQYLYLKGKPVIAHTLLVFDQCPEIDQIILVLPDQDINMVNREIISPLSLTKQINLVSGGRQRQESVFNGLQHLDSNCKIVAIHDGVRPFVTPSQISACIVKAKQSGACILGIPAFDTLKKIAQDETIEETLDRQYVWMAQTPQAFQTDLIKSAHFKARELGYKGTDDASLVERLGVKVSIISGSRRNIKITTPEDLELSEAMLKR